MELNEIIEQRRQKMNALKEKGIALYERGPGAETDIQKALDSFEEGKKVALCGRITAKRSHGKVTFLDIRDSTNKIQLYMKENIIGAERAGLLEYIDIADFIRVQGELFKTHTGEFTVKVDDFQILVKSLRPLPEKWHGLKDVDVRYRQRYLDLLSNEEVRGVFKKRSRIIKAVRDILDGRGFQEVETPMMHFIPGGAAGRPFKSFHNEYSMELFLRIAPELYLKKLLVGGMDKVYEINRSFRNEGVSIKHNPEFTMLEVYCAYANYDVMMQLCQDIFVQAAQTVCGKLTFSFHGKTVDLTPPWQVRSFAQMVKERFAIEPSDDASVMLKKIQEKGFAKDKNRLSRSQINKIIEDILEQDMSANPTFVTDYFTYLCPLAKTKKDNPLLSERFELYVAGMEMANAYSELNDPAEQKQRFEQEIKDQEDGDAKSVDEEYVLALEHGMPPAGGLGIGIDRMVMLLTEQASIRDVILFPLLRPEK